MRNGSTPQAHGPSATQHQPHCTCSPIRWSSPALADVDTVDLPCLAFAQNPNSVASKPEPRRTRHETTWDWSRGRGRTQRPPMAA